VGRYADKAVDAKNPALSKQLRASASRALSLFAGDPNNAAAQPVAGLQAVADFIEANVPESERNKAGEVLIRILNGTIFEMAQLARQRGGLAPLVPNEKSQAFMTQAVLALSDAPLYPAPLLLQLTDFTQVQASVFQVARAPGKSVVYLGCALLILGVFAMLYVRERRLWIWLGPTQQANSESAVSTAATMAMSTNRKTMDGDREFEQLKSRLLGLKQ
jgi:cytochrome c biogenesis protein